MKIYRITRTNDNPSYWQHGYEVMYRSERSLLAMLQSQNQGRQPRIVKVEVAEVMEFSDVTNDYLGEK